MKEIAETLANLTWKETLEEIKGPGMTDREDLLSHVIYIFMKWMSFMETMMIKRRRIQ